MRRLFNIGMGAFAPIPLSDPLTALGIASGIAGGIGNIIGSFGANSSNKKIAREQMSWQTAEREKSQQWQEMMWNKTNEYNTPSAVRARLEDAGYNPWLSGSEQVGQGASTPNVPAMPSAPNMPVQQPVRFGDALTGIIQPLLQLKGLKIQESSVNNKNAMDFVSQIPEMRKYMSWDTINQAGKKLANFGGNFGESDNLDSFISSYLKSAKSEADMSAWNALIQENQYNIDQLFSYELNYAKLNNLASQASYYASSRELQLTENDMKKIEKGFLPLQILANIQNLLADANLKNLNAAQVKALTPYLVGSTAIQVLNGWRNYNNNVGSERFWQSDFGQVFQMLTPLIDKYLELLSTGSKVADTVK